MRLDQFRFGAIRIDGVTLTSDVVIDRGEVRKRKKKASKPFRDRFGHTPLSVEEKIPWKCRTLVVGTGALLTNQREKIITLAARHALPAIYPFREFIADGGLISYGNSVPDSFRQGGAYAGRILKGDKPAELPVILSTKFEFVMNLKTAQAIGVTVPPLLLARADEVLE